MGDINIYISSEVLKEMEKNDKDVNVKCNCIGDSDKNSKSNNEIVVFENDSRIKTKPKESKFKPSVKNLDGKTDIMQVLDVPVNGKVNKKNNNNTSYPSIDAKPEDLPLITSVFMIVTKECNLSCKYCFVDQEPKKISLQTALDTVDWLSNNSLKAGTTPSINFFGGEPLLRWEDIIVPLTLYVRGKFGDKFHLSMTSNGMSINEDKLEFMKKYKIGLLFSIDGDKITQDKNRPTKNGKSSFDILKNKIPMILRYYPNMTFRSTTDHDNVNEYFNNHKFAVENGYTNVFNIVNVFANWSEGEKQELRRQVRMVGDYYIDLYTKGKKVRFSPLNDMFFKIKRIDDANLKGQHRDLNRDILAYGRCGLGANRFASVGTTGNLYSCQEIVENDKIGDYFKIGNIYTGVNNRRRIDIAHQFDPKKVVCSDGSSQCEKCKLNPICDGSCTINNYLAYGNLNKMPSILCFYYQILLEEAIRIDGILVMKGFKSPMSSIRGD